MAAWDSVFEAPRASVRASSIFFIFARVFASKKSGFARVRAARVPHGALYLNTISVFKKDAADRKWN